jgi:DegV family protein with EDD domain
VTVRILVDSTADIPPARARELQIEVVPLTVLFGDQSFQDGVDLDGPAFYVKLSTSPVMPTTSTPPPALFEERYRKLIGEGATGILALHIGSALSGTISVSTAAARNVSDDTGVPIEVLDSRSVSGGYGLPAEIVAREAQTGKGLPELKAHAESLLDRVRVIAVLDTLEFLQRGGRIGRTQAMLGTLLNFKPLIEVRDGQVLPLERVRTRSKALERMGQILAALGSLEAVAVVASNENIIPDFERVAQTFWNGPIERFSLGPVVGTHAGPGAGGIAAIVRD